MKARPILAIILLTLGIASCQKEEITKQVIASRLSTESACLQITYYINDQCHATTLDNASDLLPFIHKLTLSAKKGNHIVIQADHLQSTTINLLSAATKDVVKYETTDPEQFEQWVGKMVLEGYEVTYEFDRETGIYKGTAIKR